MEVKILLGGLVLVFLGWYFVSYFQTFQHPGYRRMSGAEYEVWDRELKAKSLLVDVRTEKSFSQGHIPGAKNIPLSQLKGRMPELQTYQDKTVVVYCLAGVQSARAAKILLVAGFQDVIDLQGISGYSYKLVK